ncbi:MAG: DUF1549 and DUF1553 domain-containing protein [Acidobacteriota bacterium]
MGTRLVYLCVVVAAVTGMAAPKQLWSLRPVLRPDVPQGVTSSRNAIDAFIAAKHQEKGLRASRPADKLTLLRRLHFDLTGLPPTPAEQDAFLADRSADAYEKIVDRLLEDKQHGVRWARHWLDVLRYTDLDSFDGSIMPSAQGIHHWRDWVIQALNQDLPYDRFVRAQILGNRHGGRNNTTPAGLVPQAAANPADQFALGFLARAALTGADKEQEIPIAAVETISSAFIGLTYGCAKCHDHRFDPISQQDYFRMKALFDPLVLRRVVLAGPAEIAAQAQALEDYYARKRAIDGAIEKLTGAYRQRLYDERVAMLPPDVRAIVGKPENKRTAAEQKTADDYFPVLRIDPPKIKAIMTPAEVASYQKLLDQDNALRRPPELPAHWIVEEDSARLRDKSYILTSGDPSRPEKDKPVEPGFPFQLEGTDLREGRREAFVNWLTAPENPLFARVAVNRIWQWHFGEGLQKVSSDFGLLGGRPSDQKLLDYLAAEFVANGYSMKWLHRLILNSDTYKMSSRADAAEEAANARIDPANTYLWRFRLQRLEAEPLWDALLSSAGQLDLSIGGKSFDMVTHPEAQRPFLPPAETFDSRKNRRGIYMARGYLSSAEMMPSFLTTFDVDDGRTVCPVRGQTITAPQALFTMNHAIVDKAAEGLAQRVLRDSAGDLKAAVELQFRIALGRPATASERDRALSYVASEAARLKGLAWLILNLDEFVFVK